MPIVTNAKTIFCPGVDQLFWEGEYREVTIECESTTHTCGTVSGGLWDTIKGLTNTGYGVGFPYCNSITSDNYDIYDKPFSSMKVITKEEAEKPHKADFEVNIYKNVELEKEVSKIYKWGIGFVGVLAFVMMTYGGILYMISGAVDQKSKAKGIIQDALIGLFLALSSFLIVGGINKSLTIIKPPKLAPVETVAAPKAPPKEEDIYVSKGPGPQCLAFSHVLSLKSQGYNCDLAPTGSLDCPTGNMNTNPQGAYICTPPEE